MTKRQLRERWQSPDQAVVLQQVLSSFKNKNPLSKIEGLEKYEGRWDLRGAVLSEMTHARTIGTTEHQLTQKFGSLKIKNKVLESVDFSYTDISYSWITTSVFRDCIFKGVKAKETHITAVDYVDCSFEKVDFGYSFINTNIGSESGSFINCQFIECNFSECIFAFPKIERCLFADCNMSGANFDGSRFVDCIFKGLIDSAWFRGYSRTAHKSYWWIFNRVDPKKFHNPMWNVDFTEAKLVGVSFENEIDLSNCQFAADENYLFVQHPSITFEKATSIIEKEWEGEDKRLALHMLGYYSKLYSKQPISLIDKYVLLEGSVGFSKELVDKFFSLIQVCDAGKR